MKVVNCGFMGNSRSVWGNLTRLWFDYISLCVNAEPILAETASEFGRGVRGGGQVLFFRVSLWRQLTAAAPSVRLRRCSLNNTGHIITAQMDCK